WEAAASRANIEADMFQADLDYCQALARLKTLMREKRHSQAAVHWLASDLFPSCEKNRVLVATVTVHRAVTLGIYDLLRSPRLIQGANQSRLSSFEDYDGEIAEAELRYLLQRGAVN